MFEDIKTNTTTTFTSAQNSRTRDIDQEPTAVKSWTKKLFSIEEEADDEEKQLQRCISTEQDSLLQRLKTTIPDTILQYQSKLTKELQFE